MSNERKGTKVSWTLLLVVAGLLLRFGVDGYNTAGDILIWIGLGLIVIQFITFIAAVLFLNSYNNTAAGKLDAYSRSLRKRK